MVELKELRSRQELRSFVNFPFQLYRESPYWIPPLISDDLNTLDLSKNPAARFCRARYWMAFDNGRPVGRVAGIINDRYVEKWGNRNARFGWIDFVDSPDVSSALLGAVEEWARAEGMAAVHGPLGFTDLDPEGMLVEGFDEMGTLPMIYNHAYYPVHMEAGGYRKDVDWLEYRIQIPKEIPDRIIRVEEAVRKRLKLRLLDARKPKDILPYAPAIFETINETYAHLYGVVELTPEQIKAYVDQYFGFIRADFVKVVLNERDDVVAFGIAAPSMSEALRKAKGRILPFGFLPLLHALRSPKVIDLYLGAVRREYQGRGVTALLMRSMHESAVAAGVAEAESSGNLESNEEIQAVWKYYPHRLHKRRRCYIKQL
ncbi:GNAT family N-acetyltransferase [Salinispira pacifica]